MINGLKCYHNPTINQMLDVHKENYKNQVVADLEYVE